MNEQELGRRQQRDQRSQSLDLEKFQGTISSKGGVRDGGRGKLEEVRDLQDGECFGVDSTEEEIQLVNTHQKHLIYLVMIE